MKVLTFCGKMQAESEDKGMNRLFMGIDQGTTGTTVLLFDEEWNQISKGYCEHTQSYPSPGLVEQDPRELWQCVLDATEDAFGKAKLPIEEIARVASLGLANQGETVVLWNKESGEPVYPAIVWQDRRTSAQAKELAEGHGEWIREKTGLLPDAYFSATKICWVMEHVPGVKQAIEEGKICAGTLDTWLIWNMTGGSVFVTDPSTASRTMLFNIHTGTWDTELLELLGIPEGILPEICESAHVFGHTDPKMFFGASIPVSGSLVDQQAALFGQACFKTGMVKATYGTGCFLLMNTGDQPVYSKNGLLTTVGWGLPGESMTFALDAGIYIAGAAIQWLRDKLKIIENAAQTGGMASSVPDTGGVYFVPAFSGLAAPYWDPFARGSIMGITGGTTQEHIVRAALESIAYQVKDNVDLMIRDSGIPIEVLRVDGGMTGNEFLMQFQADILGIPVDVPAVHETTGLGAAVLAALGMGYLKDKEEMGAKWKLRKRYEPRMDEKTREQLLARWHKAVERSLDWE